MGRLQSTVQKETSAHDNTLVSTASTLFRGEGGGWGGCLHGNVPTVQNKNHLVGKTFHSVQ